MSSTGDPNIVRSRLSREHSLEAIADLMPGADPDLLMAAADEVVLIAEAGRRLGDMGVIKLFGFEMLLNNGKTLNASVDIE